MPYSESETYYIQNENECIALTADELISLHLGVGDHIGATTLADMLTPALLHNPLRHVIEAMIAAAPDQDLMIVEVRP